MEPANDPGPSAKWHAALAQGRLLLQRNAATGEILFPPRPLGAAALDWVEASGRGTVYSLTSIARKPPLAAHQVAIVDLEEGVRMMGALELPEGREAAIGDRVIAAIADQDGVPQVVFRPA